MFLPPLGGTATLSAAIIASNLFHEALILLYSFYCEHFTVNMHLHVGCFPPWPGSLCGPGLRCRGDPAALHWRERPRQVQLDAVHPLCPALWGAEHDGGPVQVRPVGPVQWTWWWSITRETSTTSTVNMMVVQYTWDQYDQYSEHDGGPVHVRPVGPVQWTWWTVEVGVASKANW